MSEFGTRLLEIHDELKTHTGHSKEFLMTQYVKERLNKSVAEYYKELGKSLDYLRTQDLLAVNKKLNKEREPSYENKESVD